jgi:hypothetical protein
MELERQKTIWDSCLLRGAGNLWRDHDDDADIDDNGNDGGDGGGGEAKEVLTEIDVNFSIALNWLLIVAISVLFS